MNQPKVRKAKYEKRTASMRDVVEKNGRLQQLLLLLLLCMCACSVL